MSSIPADFDGECPECGSTLEVTDEDMMGKAAGVCWADVIVCEPSENSSK